MGIPATGPTKDPLVWAAWEGQLREAGLLAPGEDPRAKIWTREEIVAGNRAGINPFGYKVADPRPPSGLGKSPRCGSDGRQGSCRAAALHNSSTGLYNRCPGHGGLHATEERPGLIQNQLSAVDKLRTAMDRTAGNPDLLAPERWAGVYFAWFEQALENLSKQNKLSMSDFKDLGDIADKVRKAAESSARIRTANNSIDLNTLMAILGQVVMLARDVFRDNSEKLERFVRGLEALGCSPARAIEGEVESGEGPNAADAVG